MDNYFINVGPFLLILVIIAVLILLGIIAFLAYNVKGLKAFGKHDNELVSQFLIKFPNVPAEFVKKDVKTQNVAIYNESIKTNKRMDLLEAQQNAILEILRQLCEKNVLKIENNKSKSDSW